ncbi:hypothetical protein AMTR_s00152p00034900 [Amborella trichopoda]|uniref:Uncharacterized protein n=1 Tax=Amborella trichopoda TaxID=13333 RepID=W1PL33_AMBTC|nr:hypothetical protein AMTR_s00152p00034900 [Amborella trichopoda]
MVTNFVPEPAASQASSVHCLRFNLSGHPIESDPAHVVESIHVVDETAVEFEDSPMVEDDSIVGVEAVEFKAETSRPSNGEDVSNEDVVERVYDICSEDTDASEVLTFMALNIESRTEIVGAVDTELAIVTLEYERWKEESKARLPGWRSLMRASRKVVLLEELNVATDSSREDSRVVFEHSRALVEKIHKAINNF